MFDKIVRLAWLAIAAGFLIVSYMHVQNGRYHRIGNGEAPVFTMDSRTGDVYVTLGVSGPRKLGDMRTSSK